MTKRREDQQEAAAGTEVKPPPSRVTAFGFAKRLLADSVYAGARLILVGFYRQAHLLVEGSAEEAADAVVLPVCGLGDLGQGCAFGAAQKFQDRGFLRSFARCWPKTSPGSPPHAWGQRELCARDGCTDGSPPRAWPAQPAGC